MAEPLPQALRLIERGAALQIAWAPERSTTLSARVLRASCRCGRCRNGRAGEPAADIALIAIEPFGPGAVRLVFSDGHDRGLYPFAYLASLAGREPQRAR